jgi:hypothetical protein
MNWKSALIVLVFFATTLLLAYFKHPDDPPIP